jgi:hypothetical protein
VRTRSRAAVDAEDGVGDDGPERDDERDLDGVHASTGGQAVDDRPMPFSKVLTAQATGDQEKRQVDEHEVRSERADPDAAPRLASHGAPPSAAAVQSDQHDQRHDQQDRGHRARPVTLSLSSWL